MIQVREGGCSMYAMAMRCISIYGDDHMGIMQIRVASMHKVAFAHALKIVHSAVLHCIRVAH